MTNWYKWTHCFVEFVDDDGTRQLSCIPWHVFLIGWAFNYDFKFVPPWKIHITHN